MLDMWPMAVKRCRFSYLDWIQDDLLVEILLRLPIKTIHRYKSVSKHWSNLISADDFVSRYNAHMNTTETSQFFGIFCEKPLPLEDKRITLVYSSNSLFKSTGFSFRFLPPSSSSNNTCVLSSDNGLVLCSKWLDDPVVEYIVCNPLTKKWVSIPPAPSADLTANRVGFLCKPAVTTVDFNNKTSSTCSSFIIVCVPKYWAGVIPSFRKIEIYDSEIGEWAQVDLGDEANCSEKLIYCPDCPYRRREFSAIVCKELLHWKLWGYVFIFNPFHHNTMTKKKKSMGQHNMVELPVGNHGKNCEEDLLGECKGRLRYTHLDYNRNCTIWELLEYNHNNDKAGGEYWRVVHKISLYKMTANKPRIAERMYLPITLLGLHPFDGDIIFMSIGNLVVSCNMREKKTTNTYSCATFNETAIVYLVVLPWWPVKVSHKS